MSLAILSNVLIVFYSCLSEEGTKKLNTPITNAFISIVNTITKKDIKKIAVSSTDLRFSTREEYAYNDLPGYANNEIPLGSAKEIRCLLSPSDATDQSVVFEASPKDAVVINQSGLTASVVGMKTGSCVIKVKSHDGDYESILDFKVVETKAPTNFDLSFDKILKIGQKDTLKFDINGGVLGHDELINFRYYDVRKLSYFSSNNSVATVDDKGVITAINEGKTNIVVSNSLGVEKSIKIEVSATESTLPYSNLCIKGSSVCYANDMILDQNSKSNHFQLTPTNNETELNPEDFIWSSSNDLLARVDCHGILRGFRKTSNEDESVIIKAVSKKTLQETNHEVVVKVQLPSKMVFSLLVAGEEIWSPSSYTVSIGDNISIKPYFTPSGCDRNFTVTSSNEEVVSCMVNGDTIGLNILKEGLAVIKITSNINQELSVETTLTVVKAGAISAKDVSGINRSIRKGIGHSAVFMIAQLFTFLTFYMFFVDKKWWLYSLLSLTEGLLISVISELIQYFVPTRTGSFTDVFIDFIGVVVGFAVVFVILVLLKKIKFKKEDKGKSAA